MKVDATNGACEVFSFKDGMLSRLGHDVKLQVKRFELTFEAGTVVGWFDPRSIETLCAMKDGVPRPGTLSEKDKRKIEQHVRNDILDVGRYPKILFESTTLQRDGDGFIATGTLVLHGVEQMVTGLARRVGQSLVCELELDQTHFGITPFRALFGALKIQPQVLVKLTFPML